MDLLLVKLTMWFSRTGQATKILSSVKSRIHRNAILPVHTCSHLYKHLFHNRGFKLKESSLDLKIPVHFEMVYFLSALLLLHFFIKSRVVSLWPFLSPMAACKDQCDFFCSIASAFDAPTKVSNEWWCVVIASFLPSLWMPEGCFNV